MQNPRNGERKTGLEKRFARCGVRRKLGDMLQIERHPLNHRQLVIGNIVLMLVCLATAVVGFWLALPGTPMTVFWPPAGLALAALFRYGAGLSLGAWLGAFGGALLGFLHNTTELNWPAALTAAAIMATGGLGALWLGKQFLERATRLTPINRQVRQVALICVAGVVGSVLSATAGVAALYLTSFSAAADLAAIWMTWWISCSLGVFLFTPLVLAWAERTETWHRRRRTEAIVCLTLLVGTTFWAFLSMARQDYGGAPMSFLVLPFLTWAAVRLGYRATTTALLVMALIAVVSMKQGIFPAGSANLNLAMLLMAARFMCVIPTTLCIAAVVRERAEAEQLLQLTNQQLETRVQRRTTSLRQLTEQLRTEAAHQKQTADALRESQERVELAVRAAQIGYWDADLTTLTTHYSPEWKSQLGYGPDELPDNFGVWRQLLHPEDREAAQAKVADYLEGRIPVYEAEFRLRHKDGTYRWIYSRGTLVKDPTGKPVRLMGCHQDITNRKRANLKLEAFALLGKQLSAANTVREAAQLVVDVAEPLLGWDAAVLVMFEEKTGLCRAVLDMDLINGRKTHVPSEHHDKEPSARMRRTIEHGPELVLRPIPARWTEGYRSFGDHTRPSASMMFVPVRDAERTVAMLSIQSYQPNAYTAADLDTLQALADHCGGALARIRSREIQKESELNLVAAQLQARMGSWEFIFETQTLQWSHGVFVLFDRDPANGAMALPEFIAHVYPPDRDLVTSVFARMSELTAKYTYEFRYLKSTEQLHHFTVTLECIRDAQNQPLKATGIIQDITRQKQAEQALRESSERLRLALDVAQMGTWDLDLTTYKTVADERLSKMFGGPTTQPLSRPEEFRRCIHPDDMLPLRTAVQRAITETSQFHERFRVIWPDQSVHWLEACGSLFRGPEGQPLRVVGATVDITERHQAEEALRRSEKQYAELVNNIDGIVWEADVRTLRMTFVSHQAENILGYPAATWVENATFWQDHIHPEDREFAMNYCAARTARGEDHSFEYRMIAADGREVWLADFVTVIMEQGRPVTLRGVMVDITRRMQLEHEQARSYSLLQTTLESSRDGLLVVDRQGLVRIFNQRFLELWRLPSDLVTKRNDQDWLGYVREQLENADDFLAGVQQLQSAPELESFDTLVFKDGRIYERHSRPQRLKGEIIGRVWSFRDVTERRRNERLMLGQTKILEDIARGLPFPDTLAEICRMAESSSPGLVCSVLLVDDEGKQLRHGAAPNLPAPFWQVVDGIMIGPNGCSCGTAAYREATVIVEDIAADPLWAEYRELALASGLRACWSTPIFDAKRRVAGTLAFYYATPKRPTSRERRIIEMATHSAAVAILKHRSDQQLARSAKILRQLSANLMDVHEAERRHLARELHDEIGQTLTATKILLESHRHDLNGHGHGPGETHPPLRTAIGHVETMLQQVRTLSLSLRPTILDDCGLPAALRWLLDQHTQTTGRPVAFELKFYEGEVEPAIETACFRIAQEALTNISRHSQARQVNVELQCDAGHLTLVVRDDGVGFDVASATARAHAGGSIGLLGQQERAALLGGRVDISSRPGAGTEIRARFPLPPALNGKDS